MAAARSLPVLLLAWAFLAASPEPAAAASTDRRAFLGLREASQPPPAERPEPQESSESRLAFMLSRLREGVWRGRSQPLALAQWAASRSHQVQPEASIDLPGDLPEPDLKTVVVVTLVNIVVTVTMIGLLALLYTKFKPSALVAVRETEDKASLDGDFKHGLFSCFETPRLSFLVCCCPGIRWSDTARMAGVLAFPTAVLVVVLIYVLGILFGFAVAEVCLAIAGITYRRKLRKLFSMEDDNTTMFADCLKWCCCMCCTVVQEARQLEEAKLLGHDAAQNALPLQLSWAKSDAQTESP